ncbi:MAG: formylglycine-generating enzyme family protein [Acidobacteriota bacterium]
MATALVPDLATIPAGPFVMGADHGRDNERPAHEVTLDSFTIGATVVTNAEYLRFVRSVRHRPPGVHELPVVVRPLQEIRFREFAAPYTWQEGEPPAGRSDHPVVLVGLDDARDYCRWLSAETGRAFRLPTEAEWEKAARGGVSGQRYPWGDDIDVSRANFLANPSSKPRQGTSPVRTFPPNGYGLHDAAGNVWEWVSDWYRSDYYSVSPMSNPTGPATGALRLVRGGSWTNDDVDFLRCAFRHPVPPDTYSYSIGFRVVCVG